MKGVYSFCLFCNCVCLFVCLFVCKLFFLSKISLMILKFGTKFDSDELFCVTKKTATYCLSVTLCVHFSFSQMKFLSQISQLLLEPVFSNFVYTFR